MKRTFLFSFTLITLPLSALIAQTSDSAQLPVKSGNEWQMPKDVLVRSRAFADHWQKLLTLDSVTTQKVFALYLGNRKPVDEIRVGAASDGEKKAALAANQREFDQKMKELLTSSQFDRYMRERKVDKL